MYMCVCVHAPVCGVCTHAYVYKCHVFIDALKGQKRVWDPMELNLQVLVSHLACILGMELRSCEEL